MANAQTMQSVANVYKLLGIAPPNQATLQRIANEIEGGRSWTDLRNDIINVQAAKQGIPPELFLQEVIRGYFTGRGAKIATETESEYQRIARITREVLSGQRTLSEVRATIYSFAVQPGGSGGGSTTPPPPKDPPVPQPPPPPPPPASTPIDYRARAAALYPFLPPSLLDVFAEKWADTGDVDLALAETRADSRYDSYFPGIKRADGSLRMSESEYLGRIDGYHMALSQFGLNSTVFSNHFVEMIEGDLDPSELASRLGAAYDQIITAMPGVRAFYSANYGVDMTDEAIFASFIDPDLGNAILNQRIAVSQIGGAGAAFGFQIDLAFAERIRQQGLGATQANKAFAEAAYQIPILDTLARRFDTDPDVDLIEFTNASIFADPAQIRRLNRIRGAETSSFTDPLGTIRTGSDFAVTGLGEY